MATSASFTRSVPGQKGSASFIRHPREAEEDEENEEEEPQTSDQSCGKAQHRFEHENSVLAVVVNDDVLYAGTQNGEILVFDLQTYQRLHLIDAHSGAVLGLCLTQRAAMLLSSAGDRHVNIWEPKSMSLLAILYSTYDIGDIFCVAWSPVLQTVYLGSQNTSIQWFNFKHYDPRLQVDHDEHPIRKMDPFFPAADIEQARLDSSLMIRPGNIQRFAHYGYVYCMLLVHDGDWDTQQGDILISGGGDGVIKLWTLDGQDDGRPKEVGVLDDGKESGEPVLSLALDGTFLYGARVNGMIDVWDLDTRQLLRTIDTTVREDVLTLSVGRGVLYAGLVDGSIMSFNQRHDLVSRWQAHDGRVLASCFVDNADQTLYITGSNDNSIAIWNGQDTKMVTPVADTGRHPLRMSLERFVSYHSVSSDPGCAIACRSAAHYLRDLLKNFGAATQILPNSQGFNPVLYALFRGNNKSKARRERIIFYGHYDVIAADNTTGRWKRDPFELHSIDDHMYGRGVSDNKGPIIAATFAVAELVARSELAADVVFLIEGEEEMGSRGFQETIRCYKDLIGPINWILLANSYWINDEVPCLTYGLRGVLRATLSVESDQPDLHSGVDGSKLNDEPMKDLVMLLSRLSSANGRIEIPGFYDNILEVANDELRLYHEVSQALLARDPNLCGGNPEILTASLMGRWREANLTIHRIRSSGPANSTIISQRAEATISIRLVPKQEVDQIREALETYLDNLFDELGSKNHFTISVDHTAEPWLGVRTNKLFKTLEHAVTEVWDLPSAEDMISPAKTLSSSSRGMRTSSISRHNHSSTSPASHLPQSPTSTPLSARPRRKSSITTQLRAPTSSTLTSAPSPTTLDSPIQPHPHPINSQRKLLYIREGGSIPTIRFLEKEFNAQAAHLPCGQASDAAHLDNERLRVLNFIKAKEVFGRVFAGLE